MLLKTNGSSDMAIEDVSTMDVGSSHLLRKYNIPIIATADKI
jgi:hypothetical protein